MIYLVRHGETKLNREGVLQGRSDYPLDEAGKRQAEETAAKLREMGVVFTKVYSSPLIRAVETAEIIAGPAAEIVTDERLLEMDYGPYGMTSLNPPAPELLYFFQDFVNHPAPDGMEPLDSVVGRLKSFMDEIRNEEGDILVSTHAIAMKGALEYLTPDSKGSYWSKYIGNCAVYRTVYTDGNYAVPEEALF